MSVSTPSQFRPEVPASIWGRTGRPRWATIIRLYIAFSLIWIGLFFDGGIARWAWIGAGVGVFLLFPVLTRLLLRPLEREVLTATRRTASHRLGLLRARRLVRTFAPHGWRSSQEATLHLIAGDGQAAAQAYAETGRLARLREPSAVLLSGQVHAWILAKDLSKAREVSSAREKLGDLGPWDRLHRAVLLLAAGQRDDGVRAELEELRETLGDHPWILAGLILAHERDGELDRALALSEEATAVGVADDELAATLLKRADKGLRVYKKNLQRQERKRAKAQEKSKGAGTKESVESASEDPRNPRGSKKARKQARREARRRAKAEERHRRSEEAARRQRELKTRAQRAKKTPEPAGATAQARAEQPQSTAARPGAGPEQSTEPQSAAARPGAGAPKNAEPQSAAARPGAGAPDNAASQSAGGPQSAGAAAQAPQSTAAAQGPQSAAPESVSAPVVPSVSASSPSSARADARQATSAGSTAPAASVSPDSSRGSVILPPLVRPGERAASSRSKPPPPPVRARGPRTAVPTPRPPRLNLPRLVGSPPAAGLPTRSAKQPVAAEAPRVLVPPPVVTAPQEESGEWGDLDTLFQD